MSSPWPTGPVGSIVHNLVDTVTEFHWQIMYNIVRILSERQKFGSGNDPRRDQHVYTLQWQQWESYFYIDIPLMLHIETAPCM